MLSKVKYTCRFIFSMASKCFFGIGCWAWLSMTANLCSCSEFFKVSLCMVIFLVCRFSLGSRMLVETKLDVTRPLGSLTETHPFRIHPNIVRTANRDPTGPRRTSTGTKSF